jgi:hypothetical protein
MPIAIGRTKIQNFLFALDSEVQSTSGDRKGNFQELEKVRNYNTTRNGFIKRLL